MKKLILALTAVAAILFGFGAPASAQYGTVDGTATVSPGSTTPGGTVTVTFSGCAPGETVTFTFQGVTVTATCSAVGNATATFTAPTTPGSYTGNAVGVTSGVSAAFVVVVQAPVTPPGGLPATGSGGINGTVGIGVGLFAIGLGLFGVAQLRRRQPSMA